MIAKHEVESEPRPIVILSGWEEGAEVMDVELTPYNPPGLSPLEPYVKINPSNGLAFTMRISELQNALMLIDNAGDALT